MPGTTTWSAGPSNGSRPAHPGRGARFSLRKILPGGRTRPGGCRKKAAGRPLITTGLLAGTLHRRGVRHPWLDRATGLMWDRIDELDTAGPYDLRAVAHFLDHVPDRDRAAAAIDQLAPLITSPEW